MTASEDPSIPWASIAILATIWIVLVPVLVESFKPPGQAFKNWRRLLRRRSCTSRRSDAKTPATATAYSLMLGSRARAGGNRSDTARRTVPMQRASALRRR